MPPAGSSTTPATEVAAPWGSRRPARHGEPSARVPLTDTDDVPTDTNTPLAPIETAKSRHASAVYPFAMPPRSRRGLGTSTPSTDSAGRPSAQRRSPTRDNSPQDDARNAASTARADGAGGKGLPATYAARIALISHAATSGPIIGLNAPPVASASASASRSSRSVSSLTTRPGPASAESAASRETPSSPPAEAAAALSRDTSEETRNTLHRSSWRATTSTMALTIAMPSPPQPIMSTRVPIAGNEERHIGGTEDTGAPSRAAPPASPARATPGDPARASSPEPPTGPAEPTEPTEPAQRTDSAQLSCRSRRRRRPWWSRSGRGC